MGPELRTDSPPVPAKGKPTETLGIALVCIPTVAGLWAWYGANMWIPAILALLSTATLVAVESQSLGFGNEDGTGWLERRYPVTWFIGVLLIWIVEYPRYLYSRGKRGMKNLLVPGLLSAGIYLFGLTSEWSLGPTKSFWGPTNAEVAAAINWKLGREIRGDGQLYSTYKLLNHYVRRIEDERRYVFDFEAQCRLTTGEESFKRTVALVKRGSKWYYYSDAQ